MSHSHQDLRNFASSVFYLALNFMFVVLTLHTSELWAEISYYQLAELGFDAIMEESNHRWVTSIAEENYNEASTLAILNQYQDHIQYEIRKEEKQNWNQKWEESFEPTRLDNKCIIRADFHRKEPHFEYEIIITPKMSFGTGHHQTTRLMMQQQFAIHHHNKKVLDAGSGTGVLAILAAKLGANDVYACDIEDWSVENALENAAQNHVNLVVKHGTARVFEGEKFDILLANINKNVLLDEIKLYDRLLQEHGTLLLSGFHQVDVHDLVAEAAKFGWYIHTQTQEGEWCCLRLEKQKNQ